MYHQLFSHQLFDLLAFYFADLLLPRLFGFRTQVLEHPTLKALVLGAVNPGAVGLGAFRVGAFNLGTVGSGALILGTLILEALISRTIDLGPLWSRAICFRTLDRGTLGREALVLPHPFKPAFALAPLVPDAQK